MFDMIERFLCLYESIQLALIQLKLLLSFSTREVSQLTNLIQALAPIKLAAEALGRQETNIITAERIFSVLLDKLTKCQTNNIAAFFLNAIQARITERRNPSLVNLAEFLNDPTFIDRNAVDHFGSKVKKSSIVSLAKDILGRLTKPDEHHESNVSSDESEDVIEVQELDLKSAFEKAIMEGKKQCKKPVKINSLAKEISLFESTHSRTQNLDNLFNYVKTIQVTSIESERAFSASGLFVTKMRSRLSPSTVNALCFLQSYLQK